MALSHAERQRRYRERKRAEQAKRAETGDDQVTPTVTGDPATVSDPRQPRYLRVRGRRLWAELTEDDDPDPTEIVLIEEACRIVDRLDKLDAILGARDKAWVTFEMPEDGSEVAVVVDKALSEARQQQIALKQLLAELRTARSGRQALKRLNQPPAVSGGAGVPGGVADLTARIAARSAQAAG